MSSKIAALLGRLHAQSQVEVIARARSQFRGSTEEFLALADEYEALVPRLRPRFLEMHGMSTEDTQSSQGTNLLLAIAPDTGRFLRNLVFALRPSRILELGSSCGVSTLYFADALRSLANGTVTATEINHEKCASLRANITAAGVNQYVDLREGDVFATISGLHGTFDIVFLDVWADAYLPLFRKVERLLRPGSIVITDNMYSAGQAVQSYKQYLDGDSRFTTTTLDFDSGVEFTVVI